MIKPHGSDELNPLFVYDSKKRSDLLAEAETAAVAVAQFCGCCQCGHARRRLLQPADRLYESG